MPRPQFGAEETPKSVWPLCPRAPSKREERSGVARDTARRDQAEVADAWRPRLYGMKTGIRIWEPPNGRTG